MQGDLAQWLDAASGTDEEFVDRAWRLVLRRAPEPDGRERALAKLRDGTLSRAGLLRQLVRSEEFAALPSLDAALAFAAGERARPREGSGPGARASCARPRRATSARSRSRGPRPLRRRGARARHRLRVRRACISRRPRRARRRRARRRRSRQGRRARPALGRRRRAQRCRSGRVVRPRVLHLDARARRPRQRGLRRRRRARRRG